jgi:hypothetical protein
MTTLKAAREAGNLTQFVKEHKRDPKGSAAAFNHTLGAMAGKSKAVPKASSVDDPAD